jgi:hypothetical protein
VKILVVGAKGLNELPDRVPNRVVWPVFPFFPAVYGWERYPELGGQLLLGEPEAASKFADELGELQVTWH